MDNLTKMHPDSSSKRIFFTDYFNTWHWLTNELKLLMDGEAYLIGTVQDKNLFVCQ